MDGRLVVSHHPSKFGGLRHCGSRYIIILVVEDKVPHAHLTPPLLLTYKVMAWNTCHAMSSTGQMHLEQQ